MCGMNPKLGGILSGVEIICSNLSNSGIENIILTIGNSSHDLKSSLRTLDRIKLSKTLIFKTSSLFSNPYGIGWNFGFSRKLPKPTSNSIIVLHQVYTLSTVLGYRYARKNSIPFVVMPHGSLTHYHESYSITIKSIAKKIFISNILKSANAIIVTCESEKSDIEENLQSKVFLIKYGAASSENSPLLNKVPINDNNQHRILFSGRFDKKKNLPLILRSVSILLATYPRLRLDVAGSGSKSEEKKIFALVRELRIESNVNFYGWIDKIKMEEIFRTTRLLILPSDNENFAIVVSEALSHGVPCIVSKFVGTSDLIAKHHAGEIINEMTPEAVADAVIKVLCGDEAKYRAAALKAVSEDLDWLKIALQWKTLIRSIAVE